MSLNSWEVLVPEGVMDKLTNLRSFVWFCQLSGFIPFRMRIDPETKKFSGFSFGLHQPLTWWFFVSKIVFLGYLYILFHSLLPGLLMMLKAEEVSLRANSFLIQIIFLLVILVTIQYIILRCSHLKKAIELIQKADETLRYLPHKAVQKDTVIRRTLIGVVTSIALVKIFNCFPFFFWFISNSSHCIVQIGFNFWSFQEFYDIGTLWIMIETQTSLQYYCWLLLIHLSYYILAHQIQILRAYLSENVRRQPHSISLAGVAEYPMYVYFLIHQLLFWLIWDCRTFCTAKTKMSQLNCKRCKRFSTFSAAVPTNWMPSTQQPSLLSSQRQLLVSSFMSTLSFNLWGMRVDYLNSDFF